MKELRVSLSKKMLKFKTEVDKTVPTYKEIKLQKSTTDKISLSFSNCSGCSPVIYRH